MHSNNLVVLRGRVSSEPTARELPSGSVVTNIELTTPTDDGAVSVPVVIAGAASYSLGDELVVVGSVRRRFFRAGGATQSRTEVVASEIVRAKSRSVARLVRLAQTVVASRP